MRIKRIELDNFRLFDRLEIEFPAEGPAVFIGKNGSGKSSILDALGYALAQFVASISSANRKQTPATILQHSDITIGKRVAQIAVQYDKLEKESPHLDLDLILEEASKRFSYSYNPPDTVEKFGARIIQEGATDVPILAYYRIDRTSGTQSSDKRKNRSIRMPVLFAYENSLTRFSSSLTDLIDWFIDQENLENQVKLRTENLNYTLPSLDTVRTALARALAALDQSTGFGRLYVERSTNSAVPDFEVRISTEASLLYEKDGLPIPLTSLSAGEKSFVVLVADLARRLYIANPENSAPLEGFGIVLIDEIELHLHPEWQRNIISSLQLTFPGIQFVVTTHSPQVLSKVRAENVLTIEKGQILTTQDPYGRDSNAILEEVMDTTERPREADRLVTEIFGLLSGSKAQVREASKKIDQLKQYVTSDDPVFNRFDAIRMRRELVG